MPPNQENTPGQGPGELEVLKEQVRMQTVDELKKQAEEALIKSSEVIAALEHERKNVHVFEGSIDDKNSLKGKATEVRRTVIKLLLSYEQHKTPLPEPIAPITPATTVLAQKIFEKIERYINPADVSDQTAPYLFQILYNTIQGNISDVQTLVQELRNIQNLGVFSPLLYKKLYMAFTEVARDQGLSQEDIKKQFENINHEEGTDARDYEYTNYFGTYYQNFPFNERDKKILRAIHNPDRFLEYVDMVREEIKTSSRKETGSEAVGDELDRLASEKLERELLNTLAKPYAIVDQEKPTKTFAQVVQGSGVMYGIDPTMSIIRNALTKLQQYFVVQPAEKNPLNFYKKQQRVIKETIEKERKRLENSKVITKDMDPVFLAIRRVDPIIQSKKVTLSDFLLDMRVTLGEFLGDREYLHNINYIFHQPAGKDGFWAMVKEQSEHLSAASIDEIMMFPDSDIMQTAHKLYIKNLQTDFAAADYIHSPEMFIPVRGTRTEIQEKTLEGLKKIYGEIAKHEPARLETALNMAIGLSRGILFEEAEIGTYADPPRDPETGKPIITSYGLRDSSPYKAGNPGAHEIERWPFEISMSPMFFIPTEGLDLTKIKDHRELWDLMKQHRQAYLYGKKALEVGKDKDGKPIYKKLFIDFLMNPTGIAGPFGRKGWRYLAGLFGHFEYEYINDASDVRAETGDILEKRKGLKYLETWQNLEYVGYEAVWHFTDFIKNREKNSRLLKSSEERTKLFRYLFKHYFKQGEGELDTYLGSMKDETRKELMSKIKNREFSWEGTFEEAVEAEISKKFLDRALARVIALRMPTKFIRLEKNKDAVDGVRAWEKVRRGIKQTPEIFNQAVDDICLVETILRKKVSDRLKEQQIKGRPFYELKYENIGYELTVANLEDALKKIYMDEGGTLSEDSKRRIDAAKEVFTKLNEMYASNADYLNKYKSTDYPFTFGTEEFDLNYISFAAMGSRIVARAVGDMSDTEMKVSNNILKFPELLKEVSINGEHKFEPILKVLLEIRNQVETIAGPNEANIMAGNLVAMTIAYFKKDSVAIPLMGALASGRKNSLAAEFAERSAVVWEWDGVVADRFFIACETTHILPRNPYELHEVPEWESNWTIRDGKPQKVGDIEVLGVKISEIPILNWFTQQRKKNLKTEATTGYLRGKLGGTLFHVLKDLALKYGILALFAILIYLGYRSFAEFIQPKEK